MAKARAIADLSARAVAGAESAVRVTPRAGRNAVIAEGGAIRVLVTEAPADGRATAAVQALLAEALGVAKSRLTLASGAASRNKVFRLD